jgi:hypothetical protein
MEVAKTDKKESPQAFILLRGAIDPKFIGYLLCSSACIVNNAANRVCLLSLYQNKRYKRVITGS